MTGSTTRRNMLLILLYLFTGVLSLEIGARLAVYLRTPATKWSKDGMCVVDDTLGYRMVPGFQRGGIHINQLGFRGKDFAIEKPPGMLRIVCLGNSITFGDDIEADSLTYPSLLEKSLNGSKRIAATIEVINAGVSGYTSLQCLQFLKHAIIHLQPDLIILCVGWNDITMAKMAGWHEQLDWRLQKDVTTDDEVVAISVLKNILRLPTPVIPRRINAFVRNLDSIATICRDQKIPLAFLDPPTIYAQKVTEAERKKMEKYAYEGDQEIFLTYRDSLAAVAQRNACHLLDSGLTYSVSGKDQYLIDHKHPNEQGVAYMVDFLYPQIVSLINELLHRTSGITHISR